MSQRMLLAALSLSAAGLVGVVVQEGYSDSAIIPVPGDVPTIGFGTTRRADGSPVRIGDKTTPPQALARALQDVRKFEGALRKCVTAPLHQYEYDAYVGFAYNVGEAAFCGSTLVKRLNAGDYAAACAEILRWKSYQGRDCSKPEHARLCGGLWTRRQAEYRQCLGDPA
jgi:lysozyme